MARETETDAVERSGIEWPPHLVALPVVEVIPDLGVLHPEVAQKLIVAATESLDYGLGTPYARVMWANWEISQKGTLLNGNGVWTRLETVALADKIILVTSADWDREYGYWEASRKGSLGDPFRHALLRIVLQQGTMISVLCDRRTYP